MTVKEMGLAVATRRGFFAMATLLLGVGMATAATLPMWVQVLQALAVPVIAAVGAWIALQQMQIAHTKLQNDLYERRYKVFEATRDLLFSFTKDEKQNIHDSDICTFTAGTLGAAFLFKNAATKLFLCEVEQKARLLQSIEAQLNLDSQSATIPVDKRRALADESNECRRWLQGQIGKLPEVFDELALTKKAGVYGCLINMVRGRLINVLCRR